MNRSMELLLIASLLLHIDNTQSECHGQYIRSDHSNNNPFGIENSVSVEITCSNLEEVHSTQEICPHECQLHITGPIGILRTNSFPELKLLNVVFLNNTKIQIIQGRAFSGSLSLRVIHLEENQIGEIPKNAFSQLEELIYLNLSKNQIELVDEESFIGCKSLKTVDLSQNNIKEFSSTVLESLLNLETLNISHNHIAHMTDNWCFHFHSLKTLLFDHNRISLLPNCSSNVDLEILSVSYNSLQILNGTYFPSNLITLDLRGNLIHNISNSPFQHLTNLKNLDISQNKLTSLPFELFVNLKKLINLDVSSNRIVSLNEGVFQGLNSLKFLNLSNISSSILPTRIFYFSKVIANIDISGNNIQDLDVDALSFCGELKFLNIDGNLFSCPDLENILRKTNELNISVLPGSTYNSKNLNGIQCFDEKLVFGTHESNQNFKFFDENFKKSAFFKFFSTFKYPDDNSIKELIKTQEKLFRNISSVIEKTEGTLLKSITQEQINIEKINYSNEVLQKVIKFVASNKRSQDNDNVTSELFAMLSQQNRAALTSENSEMISLVSSINGLKVMLYVCTFIFILFYIFKIYRQYKTNFMSVKFDESIQEIPIIERHNIQI